MTSRRGQTVMGRAGLVALVNGDGVKARVNPRLAHKLVNSGQWKRVDASGAALGSGGSPDAGASRGRRGRRPAGTLSK